MPSLLPGSLSKADETIVRKLLKVVRATKYEDPVDQDDFLTDSANTVLNYRSRIDSFAVIAELGECVFTIRSMMHANGICLGKPPSATFISLQDFAGEIVRKRQLFQERQRANAERAKVVEGMATRIARNEALEYALKQNDKPPISPDVDAISIPSSSDESAGDTQHTVEIRFLCFLRHINKLLDVWPDDCSIKFADNRSRFLLLNDPPSTVFLMSTMSPGPKL
ncbi:hypothetical protein B0H11DRAFT_2257301 [Mycena galericulata]|nr:hypothetical protein B0H11DRAFT_2257301 [Mycena galericulata]